MRRRCGSAANGVLLAAALATLSMSTQADDASFTARSGRTSDSGAAIYSHICQGCHMPDGQGAVGAGHYPALARNPNLLSWQYVAITVLNGRHGMPPFGLPADQVAETLTVHLSDAQVANVVNHVRSHFGNAYADTIDAHQVGTLPHPGRLATAP